MELFTGASNIAGGNPPVPALLGLLLVTLLLRKPLHLTESELIAFYIFSVMSIIPAMSGGVRAFFPALTVPGYFAQSYDHLRDFWQVIPHWWVPKDTEIVREFFEGSKSGVPWAVWIFPLVLWSVFFFALLAFAWGLSLLLTPEWLASERLNFPLAQLPLYIVHFKALFSSLTLTGMVLGGLPTVTMIFISLLRPITDNPVENFFLELGFFT
jgi:hypothetical protein